MKRIETKVVAGAAGSGLGGVLATFTLWCLGAYAWDVGTSATDATKAIEAVPGPLTALVSATIPAIAAAIAGWLAPHTSQTEQAQQNG